MEKNYEDYVNLLAEIEKKESEVKDAKTKLNEEYKEIVETHKKDLEDAFKTEQDNYGNSLVGKYFQYTRKFEEDENFTIMALFKLDGYRGYIGQRGAVPIIYQMEGMEVFIGMRNGKIIQFNSHCCNDSEIKEAVNFAISNGTNDCTKEITKAEYESILGETMKEYYGI